ncbi:MAG: hypothetical protein JRH11_10860 [Deltaproteobacteria bacterium]|nr:hypothetical protein [Deltaproteobacteria bacterium]
MTKALPRLSAAFALHLALALAAPATTHAQDAGDAREEASDDVAAEDAEAMMTDESALDDQAAREFFTAGNNLYSLGRYHDAALQFQQAYDLSERPPLLYNIYLAHRDASENAEAAVALRLYLEAMPDADNHAALSVRLENLERGLAEQEASRVAAATTAEEAVRQEQAERERREAEERALAEDDKNIIPWIIAASGGAVMAVGVVTGILALGLASSLDENCDAAVDGVRFCPSDPRLELENKQSALSTFALMTDIFLIGGGVIAAVGLTWGLLQLGGADDEDAPAVSAMCGPTGCGASMRVGF